MMSLFGAMRTSVSGLNAQSDRMASLSDNISNSTTTGYKRVESEFETQAGVNQTFAYTSGGVSTKIRYDVTENGTLQHTNSATDLAVAGQGFFVVSDNSGTYLTRAGSFVANAQGDLVNTAGFSLMGYDVSGANGAANNGTLTKINIGSAALNANPSTKATLTANLNSNAAVLTGNPPSSNQSGAAYTSKSSMVTYDNLGNKVTLDVYFAKTGSNSWEASVYDQSKATNGGFPYSSGPMTTSTLQFNAANGALSSGSPLSVAIPNGKTMSLDLGATTQLAANFSVFSATVDGNAPTSLDHISIGNDGILSEVFQDGTAVQKYQISLGTVASPDNMTPVAGNAFAASAASGNFVIGKATEGGFGSIDSATLESSTVDLSSELTTMIETQRAYTANSKAFQGASDMLDVLTNIKV